VKFSIVIVGIAALLLSACGNMGKAATSTAAAGVASPRPTRGPGQNGVAGQITNVSTGSLVVKAQSGDVNVAFGSSTGVLKTSTGALSDIVAGACTLVTGQRDAGGAITAFMVQVQLNMNGNCTTPGIGQGRARVRLRAGAAISEARQMGWLSGGRSPLSAAAPSWSSR
jgi:hypothetical protein